MIQKWLQQGSKRKNEKDKRRLETEKAKERAVEKDAQKESCSAGPATTEQEEEEVDESESEDEELDQEMPQPLPTFEICKHWRNAVTSPKHVPCSVMGEWGCLYLLHELKKNLATNFNSFRSTTGTHVVHCTARRTYSDLFWNCGVSTSASRVKSVVSCSLRTVDWVYEIVHT